MWGLIKGIFSSGTVGAIENIALEYIETDKESAEAKAIMIKALDPNGAMRRELSKFASKAYGFYLIATVILIFIYALSDPQVVGDNGELVRSNIADAVAALKDLFLPITTAWGGIVSASFGINGMNAYKGK